MVPVYGGVLIGVGCFLFTFAALAFAILIAVALKKGKGFSDWLKGKYSQAKGIEKEANKALSGVTQTPAQLPGNGPNNSTAKPVSQLGNPSKQPVARPPIPGLKDTDPCTSVGMIDAILKVRGEIGSKNATLQQTIKPKVISCMGTIKSVVTSEANKRRIRAFAHVENYYIENCVKFGVNNANLEGCPSEVKNAIIRVLGDVIVPSFKKIYNSTKFDNGNNIVCNLTDDELKKYVIGASRENFLTEVHKRVGKDYDVNPEPWASKVLDFYYAVFFYIAQYNQFHNDGYPARDQESFNMFNSMEKSGCTSLLDSVADLSIYGNMDAKLQKEVGDLQVEEQRMKGLEEELGKYEKQQNGSQIS